MAFAETAQLAVRIDLEGNAAAGIGKLQGQVNGLGKSLGRVGKGVGQVGAGIARAGVRIGAIAVGGLGLAAKLGGDFEAQLRIINTIAHETEDGLDAIGDGIKALALQGRGDLEDLSAGFYDVLSAGITDTTDALGVLDSASKLALGGLATNAEAVDLLTTAINAYGQDAAAAAADADLFAKAIEIGKVTADEIAGSFADIAPVAAQAGINIEEVAAAYGALTAQGTPATAVATQMQRAIVELLSPSKDLIALQDRLGVSFLKIAQDDGLVVALQQMRDAVGDDDEAFKALFGRIEGYKFALQTTGPQQAIYNAALEDMGNAAGTAAAQMAERQQGLNYQVGLLKTNLQVAAIELASGFLPALTNSTSKLTAALAKPEIRDRLRSIGKDIGDAIDKIDWDRVLAGAESFVDVMKGALSFALSLLDAINKLPTEIKAAGAGLIGLNKLSGGLIGQGLGNIAGGIAGAVTRGLGSKLPGVGKLFAQPVFVTNWPAGGLGGAGAVGGKGGGRFGAVGTALSVGLATVAVGSAIEQYFAQNEASTAHAAAIADTQRVYLEQSPPIDALRMSLAGVDQGIKDFRSNPFLTIVQGEALTTLEQMRADLQAQIAQASKAEQAQLTKDDDILAETRKSVEAARRTKDDVVSATDKTKRAVAENKRATERGLYLAKAATTAGSASIVSAIYANRPVITTTVNVSATSVVKKYTTVKRYGPTGGSRDGRGASGPLEYDI